MNEHDLLSRTCETVAGYLALGNERFEAHGATFVRNRATPGRYDANHVGLIRSSDAAAIEALLTRAEAEFEGLGHRRFDIDPLTPPAVEARLALASGFTTSAGLHLLLEGELKAAPKPFDIREIADAAGWDDHERLLRLNQIEDAAKHGRDADPRGMPQRLAYVQAKSPAVRFWLAYVDREAVAFLNSWPGDNGVGQVEDLFTHADYRHRGIATALLAHCVADAHARGAGPIVITAEINDTPKEMYAALGFRPLFVSRSYLRFMKP